MTVYFCSVVIYFQPEYYKDAPHFRRIGDGPSYCLEIPRAKLDYTGTYTVVASNCYGSTKAIISLQIHAKGMIESNRIFNTRNIIKSFTFHSIFRLK